ncbi:hypothetical protein EVAR_16330_1 [Eumeta japonica]|uniref:Uncharacterized protein n=1 Tax=Eumeta variegata TaxID=151549 RepID=A0A4C1VI84_EUMVA|nr:hypothetical protein EVAR_16330_1 [Eumeta japonica]
MRRSEIRDNVKTMAYRYQKFAGRGAPRPTAGRYLFYHNVLLSAVVLSSAAAEGTANERHRFIAPLSDGERINAFVYVV